MCIISRNNNKTEIIVFLSQIVPAVNNTTFIFFLLSRAVNYDVPGIPEVQAAKDSGDITLSDYYSLEIYSANLTWNDIRWLRSITSLPVVVKGILTGNAYS